MLGREKRAGEPQERPGLVKRLMGSFSHTPRTLALVWRSSRGGMVALACLTLVSALLPLAVAYAGKKIVDAVVAGLREETLRWVLLELGLVAGQALVQRALALCRSLLGVRLSLDINVKILEKAQTLELRHFEDSEFYDQLTRARREASSRPISMITQSFQLLQNILTLAGYAALLISFSGWAVLGLLLAAVPATLVEMRFSGAAFRLRNWRSPEARRQNYLEYVLANERHTKEVKLFDLGPTLLSRYRTQGEIFYREDRALAVRRAGWAYVLSLLATGAFYAAYAAMALAAAAGRLTLGNMTLYVVAFRQGQQAFQSILAALGGMYEDNLYMSNLFQYFAIPTKGEERGGEQGRGEREEGRGGSQGRKESLGEEKRFPERDREKIPLALPPLPSALSPLPSPLARRASTLTPPERGIRFEKVGFRYPGQERPALKDIDLFIPQGQSLALVGHNGAGKTTFIKLLTGLYEPTEGRILLDGLDVRLWDQNALRKRFAVVFQDFNEYQFQMRENIGVGSIEHLSDEERITRAVGHGGADAVISSLPEGLNTQLGRWFKDGVELSGGQWQKVALARAFMREEADVLILDEPTAALDAEAEQAVFERFRQLAKGRTALLISHRFPTVRMADRILVLEGGRILEEGTHQELTAAGGRYAHLFALQAKGYL